MKQKLTSALFALFVFSQAIAQNTIISLAGLGGVQFQGRMKWASMDRFISSYNACLSDQLKEPVENMRLNPGYLWGLEFQYGPFQLGYVRSQANADARATLLNGEYREFELASRLNEYYLSIAYPTNKVDIGFILGAAIHKGTFTSSYTYKGGVTSFGEDKPLNGVFDLGNHAQMTFGPRFDWGYKWLKFSFRAEYQGLFGKKSQNSYYRGDGYRDEFMRQVGPLNQGIFGDGSTHIYLPEDWNDQNNYNAYYLGERATVKYGYTGWCISLRLRFAPFYQIKED